MVGFILPLRNLLRRPLRSAIAVSGIVFAVTAYLLTGGFIEWIFWAMREATVHSRLGHIQVTRPGFLGSGAADPFDYLLPPTSSEKVRIERTPEVRLLSPRLIFSGLVSNGATSVSFIGEGVDAENEKTISRLLIITRGEGLSTADPKGVILGEGLADSLGLVPGNRVVLLATTQSGSINAVEGHVRGIFYTLSKQFDDAALRVPIDIARELLRVSGSHIWILLLDKTENTDRVIARLRRDFPEATHRLQFRAWSDLAHFYHQTVNLYSRQMDVLEVIIGLLIILSISNTITMSVMERTGEVGTMMAIGTNRKKVLQLFLMEGLLLGVIGGASGVIAGTILGIVISSIGIPMPPAPGMTHGFTGEILITPWLGVVAFLIAISTSTLASLYPAWRASRLEIVDALRKNR